MIKPLRNRVIVERVEPEEKTDSGIIIPDTAKEKPQQGNVVAVGPGVRDKNDKLIKPDVSEGDRVLFAKYGGTEVSLEGKDYLIMREEDILAVLEG